MSTGHEIPFQQRLILFAWLAPLVVALDHATKLLAVEFLRLAPRLTYLGDTLRLQYSENSGAFLGLGAGLDPEIRFWLFTVAVGILLVVILGMLFTRDGVTRGEAAGLILIGAGGFSNWIDRLLNHGVVIDFLNVGLGGLRTGIFNLADMAITGGVLFLAALSLGWGPGRGSRPHGDP
jgi:signal peptidase II